MTDQNLGTCIKSLKAIIVIGGDLVVAEDPSHLGFGVRSMKGIEGDIGGACPSYERALAAHVVWEINPKISIVVSGGLSNVPNTSISVTTARVLRAELEKLGVPSANIIEEGESFTTLEQFPNCSRIVLEHGWDGREVGLLSMGWHLPRIQALLHFWSEENISPLNKKVRYLSAERILATKGEKWTEYFSILEATPEMLQRRAGELLGTEQVLTGYNTRFRKPYDGLSDPLGGQKNRVSSEVT